MRTCLPLSVINHSCCASYLKIKGTNINFPIWRRACMNIYDLCEICEFSSAEEMWTLHCEHCTVNTAMWTLQCEHCTVNTALWTLQCEHCTLNTAMWTLHFVWISVFSGRPVDARSVWRGSQLCQFLSGYWHKFILRSFYSCRYLISALQSSSSA